MNVLAALLLAPLLQGVVRRIKALFAGRSGAPLLQGYFDLIKLLQRASVYSRTTSWVFPAGPVLSLAATLGALCLVPLAGTPALFHFRGDLFVVLYLLALVRFMTVLAALDTGSAFEGMGASREVLFSALAEPATMVALISLARASGVGAQGSLSAIYAHLSPALWGTLGGGLVLVAAALFVVFLAENARIPFDDPTTHLELTMVHEVMVLDHSGPDLALIELGVALKFWLLGSLVCGLVIPIRTGTLALDGAAGVAGLLGLAIGTGIVESSMARLRLLRVPQMLLGAGVLASCGMLLVFGGGSSL